jgi:hypothetical protein
MKKRNFEDGKLKARSKRDRQRDDDAKEIAETFTRDFDGKSSRFVNKKTNKIRPNKPVRSDFARIISAKDGFMGKVSMKTLFTVGEGNKKEFVSRKQINIFDVGMFNSKPSKSKSKKKSNNIFDVGGF